MSSTDNSGFFSKVTNVLTIIFTHPLLYIAISFGLFITSVGLVSKYVGSKDRWNEIKNEVNKIMTYSICGSAVLFIAFKKVLIE